jgi:hypothetical protein
MWGSLEVWVWTRGAGGDRALDIRLHMLVAWLGWCGRGVDMLIELSYLYGKLSANGYGKYVFEGV